MIILVRMSDEETKHLEKLEPIGMPGMKALLASVESFAGPGILVPSRNSALLRWCLANGLRVVQPMTLMSTGLYTDPAGAWLPSVIF